MLKKISLLIIFFVISISAKAESNKEIIQKIASRFDDINNIQFDFIQTSNGLVEKGSCYLSYAKKLICRYLGDEQKEIIIKNNTLIVIKKKYQKIYYYRMANSVFATILDKKKIIKQINQIRKIAIKDNNFVIEFKNNENAGSVRLFINKDTFNIAGWETAGYDQQPTSFIIKNSQTNVNTKEKFEVPNFDLDGN
jgi:outer membrane lipoprotein-sorting protein|tara:strand:+ start:1400 stop:1984 length:585 start_codon:yes stop_codon:yes gene_type:complete